MSRDGFLQFGNVEHGFFGLLIVEFDCDWLLSSMVLFVCLFVCLLVASLLSRVAHRCCFLGLVEMLVWNCWSFIIVCLELSAVYFV